MTETATAIIAVLALVVSGTTAWLTYYHRGKIRMTVPSMVVFAHDRLGSGQGFVPKVMVRCLIFSTGERGHVIEALFARLRDGASEYLFPVWGMDADSKLVRGGGLLITKTGVVAWHHFVATADHTAFHFGTGKYEVDVFAHVHGTTHPVKLWSHTLSLPTAAAPIKHDGSEQVWFDRQMQSENFKARRESHQLD
jgi:hypothetical protein